MTTNSIFRSDYNETETLASYEADEARIGTPDYQGRAYFWNYAFRHYLRDCSDERRREVHAALLAAGLPLDGTSPAHDKIICIEPTKTKMNTEYKISADLTAELTDNGYLLTVFSEKHDDYDTYKLYYGEWTQNFDSLSNKEEAASEVWENDGFSKWADELKGVAKK